MFGETSPLRGGQWRLELREHRMRDLPVFRHEQLPDLAELAQQIQDTHDIRRQALIAFMDRAADLVQDRERVIFANWSNWDFGKFRSAVRKAAAADIPVSERDEWQAYFDQKKSEIAALDGRIGDLENEINDRVFRLFDLNTEEISLIEEALEGQY
jgi:hypothetical protein